MVQLTDGVKDTENQKVIAAADFVLKKVTQESETVRPYRVLVKHMHIMLFGAPLLCPMSVELTPTAACADAAL